MSQDRNDDSFSDILPGGESLLIDDTLDRKQISLTYEKFINNQNQKGDEEEPVLSVENSHSKSISSNRGKFDQIFEDVTSVLEKFENPFEVTPGDKPKQSKEDFVDKTPSKQMATNDLILNFDDASLRTAADEFRALKEKGILGFDHSITDTNTGLIIDTRKQDDKFMIENSMIDDDSSMKLNLIPHSTRHIYTNGFSEMAEKIEHTQKDGNIHEESNRILAGQSKLENNETSNLYILDELDEDDNNGIHDLDTTNTSNAIDVSITMDEDELKTKPDKVQNDVFETATPEQEKSYIEKQDIHIAQSFSPILRDTLKIAESTQNAAEQTDTQNIECTQLELKPTQIIDGTQTETLKRAPLIEPHDAVMKPAKVMGSSPSLIEEDENPASEDIHCTQDKVCSVHMREISEKTVATKSFLKVDDSIMDADCDEKNEEEDESIIIGRLPTHIIVEESQSQTQSQTQSQAQSQLPVDLSPVQPSIIHASPNNTFQNEDGIQIEGTQNEEIYKGYNTIGIAYSDDKNDKDDVPHISSPVLLQETSSAPQAETTYMEIPNTSVPYMSGLDLDVRNKNTQPQSTPKRMKGNILDKLNDALTEDAESNKTFESLNIDLHREENRSVDDIIIREHEFFKIDSKDVLGCRSLIYHHPKFERRMCGIIREVSSVRGSAKFRIESNPDDVMELWVSEKKFAAPICLNIGDPVKYLNMKKSNFVVTGLKKSFNSDNQVKTVNGFDKILIKDKKDTSLEELEVFVYEIYFTKDIFKNYEYKIFNDESFFGQYIESLETPGDILKESNSAKNSKIPVEAAKEINTTKKTDLFNNCVFTVTLAHDTEVPGKDIIDFIEENGGLVLQEGFGEILRFKKRANILTTSPRKKKLLLKNLGKLENQMKEPASKDFLDYECVVDQGDMYLCKLSESAETSYMQDHIFGCVLATRHLRTIKYLEGLSLKWPILHLKFIERCMSDFNFFSNWKTNWQKYLLIAGECSQLSCLTSVDVFEFRDNFNKGLKLKDQITLNKLFIGASITIIRDEYSKFKNSFSKNKNKRAKSGSFRKSQLVSDEVSEESSSDDEEDEGSRERVGSLLWILRQIGFVEAVVLKPGSKLPEKGYVFVMRLEDKTAFENHYSYDEKDLVQIVDFHWLIQCLVTPM